MSKVVSIFKIHERSIYFHKKKSFCSNLIFAVLLLIFQFQLIFLIRGGQTPQSGSQIVKVTKNLTDSFGIVIQFADFPAEKSSPIVPGVLNWDNFIT